MAHTAAVSMIYFGVFNWGSAELKGSASGIQGFRGTAGAQ